MAYGNPMGERERDEDLRDRVCDAFEALIEAPPGTRTPAWPSLASCGSTRFRGGGWRKRARLFYNCTCP